MNEHKAREQVKAEAERQFLQALSAGQIHVLDRLSHWVEEGSKVLYKSPVDLVFDVVRIKPVMDRNVPPGLMTVTLAVKFDAVIQANSPWQAGIVVAGPTHVATPEHKDPPLLFEPEPVSSELERPMVKGISTPLGNGLHTWWQRFFGR